MSAADFQDAVRTAVSNALKTCISPPSTGPVLGTFAFAWVGISGVDSPAAVRNAAIAVSPLLSLPLGTHRR